MTGKDVESLTAHHEPAPAQSQVLARRIDERAARVIDSRTLFGQAREIRITHNGESYSLRQTRLGKLILTK